VLAQKNDMKGAIASYYDALNVRELLVRKTPGDDKLVQSFVDIRGKLADVLIRTLLSNLARAQPSARNQRHVVYIPSCGTDFAGNAIDVGNRRDVTGEVKPEIVVECHVPRVI
jgi:hypothetical protein